MKKKIAVLLAGVMVCTMFTACGKDAGSDAANEAISVNEEALASSAADVSTEGEGTGLTIDFDNLETSTLQDIKASDLVTLGEYNGITVEATLGEVTEKDVADYIENMKSSNPPMVDVTDRAVQDGDTVNIDYVGKYADTKEAFDGGTANGADLVIGSNSYIEGFESGLIGAKIGETRDLNLTFPADYGAESLAGKEVVFTVTVNSIKVAADDISDEWAAGLGIADVTTISELEAYANKTLTTQAEDTYKSTIENSAVQKVYDSCAFGDIPQTLINRYLKLQKQMLDYQATMYSYYYGQQLSASDLISVYMNNEGFVGTADDYLQSISTDMAKQYLMFQAIADEQGITITDEDIDTYLKEAYENASTTSFSTYEEYKASLDLETYREGLMADKAVEFIVNNANVVAAPVEATTETSAEASSEASVDAAAESSSIVAE